MECTYCKEEIKEDALECKHCNLKIKQNQEFGYVWWKIFSFIFVIKNLVFFVSFWMGFFNTPKYGLSQEFFISVGLTIGFLLTLLIYLLLMSKKVFIIATVLSFNPLIWVVNFIYLKNRWKDVDKFKVSLKNNLDTK